MKWWAKLFGGKDTADGGQGSSRVADTAHGDLPAFLTQAKLKPSEVQLLAHYRDEIRVDVLEGVRSQMNRVFQVVDDLRGQVQTLTQRNQELASQLATVQKHVERHDSQLSRLNTRVQTNAARTAHGMTAVTKHLSRISPDFEIPPFDAGMEKALAATPAP